MPCAMLPACPRCRNSPHKISEVWTAAASQPPTGSLDSITMWSCPAMNHISAWFLGTSCLVVPRGQPPLLTRAGHTLERSGRRSKQGLIQQMTLEAVGVAPQVGVGGSPVILGVSPIALGVEGGTVPCCHSKMGGGSRGNVGDKRGCLEVSGAPEADKQLAFHPVVTLAMGYVPKRGGWDRHQVGSREQDP